MLQPYIHYHPSRDRTPRGEAGKKDPLAEAIASRLRGLSQDERERLIAFTGVRSEEDYQAGLVGRFRNRLLDAAARLARGIRGLSHRSSNLERELVRLQRRWPDPTPIED